MTWNYLCECFESCRKANQKEKDFEYKIDLFLQAHLRWLESRGDIKRQVRIQVANTTVISDIILFYKNNEEIIIELKKPNNIQVNKNVRQLTSYMTLKKCRFGIYIGEKLELYYDKDTKSKKNLDPILVASIDFRKDSQDGRELLTLLDRDNYSPKKLEEYCQKKIELAKLAKYWTSREGINSVYQYILNTSKLNKNQKESLQSFLEISISLKEKSVGSQLDTPEVNKSPIKSIPAKKKKDNTLYSINGGEYVKKARVVLELAKVIMQNNPDTTYHEVVEILPQRSATNRTVITKEDWLRKSTDAQDRYCKLESDMLCDRNGVEFYISNQWTKESIDKTVLPILERFNWQIVQK
jgi:hypothetical protein